MNVLLEAAPMEGLTDRIWRDAHAAAFGGADRYYSPFLSPTAEVGLGAKELGTLRSPAGRQLPLVPQVLTKSPEALTLALRQLADAGFGEVNLNLGCPSGTVTAKGKGAALLGTPDVLRRLLDAGCGQDAVRLGVKTRLGVRSPEEFGPILALLRDYPLAEVIVHPRTAAEKYAGAPHTDLWTAAREALACPLSWNGSFFTADDARDFLESVGTPEGILCGRGLLADPAMFRALRGGPAADRRELLAFASELRERYRAAFGSERNTLFRMKEHWSYLRHAWRGSAAWQRAIGRAKTLAELDAAVCRMDAACPADGTPEWTPEERFASYRPRKAAADARAQGGVVS